MNTRAVRCVQVPRAMRAVFCLVAFTGAAAADVPRVSVFAGSGVRVSTGYEAYLDGETPPVPALDAMIGLHVTPELAIGIRAGLSRHTGHDYQSGHIDSDESTTSLMPLDLGVAAEYAEGRFAVTPWIGAHFTRRHTNWTHCYIMHVVTPVCDDTEDRAWSTDYLSYGLTASIVAYRAGANRVAVFVTVQAEPGESALTESSTRLVSYAAATIGLAYRR